MEGQLKWHKDGTLRYSTAVVPQEPTYCKGGEAFKTNEEYIYSITILYVRIYRSAIYVDNYCKMLANSVSDGTDTL